MINTNIKANYMQPKNSVMKIFYRFAAIAIVSFAVACGAGAKDKKGDLNDKKVQLQKLKDQQTKIALDIKNLQDEIAKMDPSAVEVKPKLVTITPLSSKNFDHYIDLQGRISAENISYVSPRGQGGLVKAVYVKQGEHVKKGQLLIKLDDAFTKQQIEQVKVQLNLAKSVYQRRKNLWEQKIGTEVELLQAKANVENLEKQIDLIQEQGDLSNVYAELSGIADIVNVKVGMFFTPQSAATTGIAIVDNSSLKAVVDIPENYLPRVKKGTPVEIEVPDIKQTFSSTIYNVSQTILPSSRSFFAEAKIPTTQSLKPNLIALVHIKDYTSSNTIVIPVNTLQTDEQGKYVYVMADEKGKKIARKKPVQVGEIYGDQIEVKSGLSEGEQLITEGFQSVYDGQPITTEVK